MSGGTGAAESLLPGGAAAPGGSNFQCTATGSPGTGSSATTSSASSISAVRLCVRHGLTWPAWPPGISAATRTWHRTRVRAAIGTAAWA
jgi:hypothetical protein